MATQQQQQQLRNKITLYVDTVSPFAYEAYYVLRHDAVFRNVEVSVVPIFLGGLMHKCGNTAPINIKNKDKWINVERIRWAKAFNVPIVSDMPPNFPPLTLSIMRALCAISASEGGAANDQQQQPHLTKALDALFAKYWVEGVPTHQPEVLRSVLGEVFGAAEAEKILAEANTPGNKALLLQNTDKAFDSGAFGLPWMVCTNGSSGATEGFWGVDHLGQVAQFLGLRDRQQQQQQQQQSAGWKSVL